MDFIHKRELNKDDEVNITLNNLDMEKIKI